MANSVWQLMPKFVPVEGRGDCPAAKAYLCDESAARAQGVRFTSITLGDSRGIDPAISDADSRDPMVRRYLFRCRACARL